VGRQARGALAACVLVSCAATPIEAIESSRTLVLVRARSPQPSAGSSEFALERRRLQAMLVGALLDELGQSHRFRGEDFERARELRSSRFEWGLNADDLGAAPRYVLVCELSDLGVVSQLRWPLFINLFGTQMLQATVLYRLVDLRTGAIVAEDLARCAVLHDGGTKADDPKVPTLLRRCAEEVVAAVASTDEALRALDG
jgi:hypothetical protein